MLFSRRNLWFINKWLISSSHTHQLSETLAYSRLCCHWPFHNTYHHDYWGLNIKGYSQTHGFKHLAHSSWWSLGTSCNFCECCLVRGNESLQGRPSMDGAQPACCSLPNIWWPDALPCSQHWIEPLPQMFLPCREYTETTNQKNAILPPFTPVKKVTHTVTVTSSFPRMSSPFR